MKLILKIILLMTLILPITGLYASSSVHDDIDYDALAAQCRTLSLQLDSLARIQDREMCAKNLDGLNVYFASNYISLRWINKATEVITSAIFQVSFALDTGCYQHDDIQSIVNNLKSIRNQLMDSRQ